MSTAAPPSLETRTVVRRLLRTARPAVPMLAASTVARTANLLAGAGLLVVPGAAVGGWLATGRLPLAQVLVTMVLLAVAAGLLRYAEQYAGHHVAFTLLSRMRVDLYRALVPQAPAVTGLDRSGRLLAVATRDVDLIEVFFAHTVAPVVTAVLVPVAAVVVAGLLAGPAGATVLAVGLTVGLASAALLGRRRGRELAERRTAARGALAQQVTDDVQGQAELLAFGAVGRRVDLLDARGREVAALGMAAARREAVRAAFGLWWVWGTLVAVLAVLGPRVSDGSLGPAAWVVVLLLAPTSAPAVAGVEGFARDLPGALASAATFFQALDRPPTVTSPDRPRRLDPVRGSLTFRGVTFTYPGRQAPALVAVDLQIQAGERVGVVGPTGSGKSTLVTLLHRVFDPESGQVLLDGVDLRELDLEQVRAVVAVVDQRPVLIDGTVRENLLLAAPDAAPDELDEACRLASFAPDPALPEGLDTRVGERGARLSGGQRQRLSLARALLRRSPVLVLDEATSQQDPLTQHAIGVALAARPATTVLVVAHRRSALAGVDRVLEVEAGRVREMSAASAGERRAP
ncbi:MAG: ABC transporter ATP-binding protein/permease [Cellulomonas sp.]|nr:ABC transporter ATP-binding protein/permease [Cellulomonas sp.]